MIAEKATRSVVIVDDNLTYLEEVSELLSTSGFRAVTVSDPKKAVTVIMETRPDVILMDIKMPGKSGLEVAYDVRQSPEIAHIPIVAMSGFLKSDNLPLVHLCGITKCLLKPFDPEDLLSALDHAIRGQA